MSVEVFKARDAASALKQVEQVLGLDAFILSIESTGVDVMVRASGTRPKAQPKPTKSHVVQEPAQELLQTSSQEEETTWLPTFLDPAHPKPFGEADLSKNFEPAIKPVPEDLGAIALQTLSLPSDQPLPPLASDVRDRIASARVVVLVMLETHAFFGVTVELLQELPNARILTQHEEMDLPWLNTTEPKTNPSTLHNTPDTDADKNGSVAQTAIFLCPATSARFDHIVQASSDQPDVAFLAVLPIDADLSPIAALSKRTAGVIITGDTALPDAEKRDRLIDAGLCPLWSHCDGALHPLFELDAKPVLPKLQFNSRRFRRSGRSAFAA